MDNHNGLKKCSWNSLCDYIKAIRPELYSVIDGLSPPDNYSLYVAKYPYGQLILDKGIFQVINDDNHLVPLSHSSIPNSVKEDLGYNDTIPTGLISQNSIETFFIAGNRTIPASLYTPGNMISLWRVLERNNSYQVGPLWSLTSGARSIAMLPKISDKNGCRILKNKYGLKLPPPKTLRDHWHIFKNIANHPSFEEKWSSEIIFFSKNWFSHEGDKSWAEFYKFLLNEVWQSSSFRRNQFIFDFAFSLAQENGNLKPNPYLADTVRHLIAVGSGAIPALTVATDNVSAPVSGLQRTFIEDYGLKKLAPVMVHLHHFSPEEERPVYYSLEMPTTTVFSPRSSRLSSKMSDIRELKHIVEIFFSEILKGNLQIQKTPLFSLAKNVRYDFFHSEKDKLNEILNAPDLLSMDSALSKVVGNFSDFVFPEFSPLFRGCILISKTT